MYREHWLPMLPEELQHHLHINSLWYFFLVLNLFVTLPGRKPLQWRPRMWRHNNDLLKQMLWVAFQIRNHQNVVSTWTSPLTLMSVSSTPVLSPYNMTRGWAENSHHLHDDFALKYRLSSSSRIFCILIETHEKWPSVRIPTRLRRGMNS